MNTYVVIQSNFNTCVTILWPHESIYSHKIQDLYPIQGDS